MLRKSAIMEEAELEAIDVPKNTSVDFAFGAQAGRVHTSWGDVLVTILGDRSKPAMIAYHDIGLNHRTAFGSFVTHPDNKELFKNVCFYFIDAPGAEDEAPRWPDGVAYPTFSQLVEQIHEVAVHYGLNKTLCFGMGVGLGASLLLHYAAKYPKEIAGIVLVTFNWKVPTWTETYYYKQLAYYLYYNPSSAYPRDELMIRFFGHRTLSEGFDVVSAYQSEISRMDPVNLYHLINDAYLTQPDITSELPKIRCRTVIFCGLDSAFRDVDVELISLMDKQETSYLEFHDKGGLLTEEIPTAFTVPLKHFFQAFGLCLPQLDLEGINKQLREIQSDSEDDLKGSSSSSSSSGAGVKLH